VSFFSALAEGANFKGANMTLADLESGNFEDADFTDVVLEGAFVNNAQFKVGWEEPLEPGLVDHVPVVLGQATRCCTRRDDKMGQHRL
jgi:hypothetical protein